MTNVANKLTSPNAQPFFFEGGSHGVLLVHGFTGTPGHLRPLGETLAAAGFTVLGIRLPGHGTRYEDMAQCTWQDWLQTAKEGVLTLKERCSMVSVAGLSMGGVLTLLLAEQMKITCAIPISAPTAVQNRFLGLSKYLWRLMPVISWGEHPERASQLDPAYDIGYPAFPTKAAGELNTLIRLARKNLFNITCPTLVVQSSGDETIRLTSAEDILAGIRSEHKALLALEEVPHVCTLSKEKDRIAQEMIHFLKFSEKLSEKG